MKQPDVEGTVDKNAHSSDWLDEAIEADVKAAAALNARIQKRSETDPKGAEIFKESLKRLNEYR